LRYFFEFQSQGLIFKRTETPQWEGDTNIAAFFGRAKLAVIERQAKNGRQSDHWGLLNSEGSPVIGD
jgi:hypothetical protein